MSKKASKITKKYRTIFWTLELIDWFLLWLPLIVYFFIALASNQVLVSQKVGVVTSFAIALTLTVWNILTRHNLKCPIWIFLIGIHMAINQIQPLIWMLAIATILDELVLRQAIHSTYTKLEASKVYDEHQRVVKE